jgi:hypothetical protein
MTCEQCGWRSAMRDWIVCKHCWQIFFDEEKPPSLASKEIGND